MSAKEDKRLVSALERIGRVLAVQYASSVDMEQGEKAKSLSRCGFSNVEIAEILGMTPNAVNVALHRARKSKKGVKGRAKGKRNKKQ
jgi:DNA-binding CsgD family transcriptional regulator